MEVCLTEVVDGVIHVNRRRSVMELTPGVMGGRGVVAVTADAADRSVDVSAV